MRELKVQCDCGQKFKFDVEPVNNQMPYVVNCPVCGRDGTEKANILLRAQAGVSAVPVAALAQAPAPSAYRAAPAPMNPAMAALAAASAPAPAPASLVPQAPSPSAAPRLRINSGHAAPAAVATDAGAPPPPEMPPSAPAGRFIPGATTRPAPPEEKKGNFGMGLLGGLTGTVVGCIAYYFLLKYTDFFAWKLAAVGIGALAGWLAEVVGKGEGSNELGVITAVLVLAGIVGTQYFVALGWWHEFSPEKIAATLYEENVKEAKEVVAAVPTGSDTEVRAYIVKLAAGDGEKIDPASVTAEDIKTFRETELPEYRQLAEGKITLEQFSQKHELTQTKEERATEEGTFKAIFLLLLLNKASLASLVGAAGLAYKFSSNA